MCVSLCVCNSLCIQDVEMGLVKVFYDVAADIADLPFCVTGSKQIFSKYDIFDDSVLLLRKVKKFTFRNGKLSCFKTTIGINTMS